ncbi:MAG: PadR family transcriptional regulator [Candidatus Sericytochromatia bacterium]|nr:PadR family transcriptional regulator [Candidatus Sericytochromatia bacterium]
MLELAILGVLKEKPMHGYELRHYLSFIVGHIWQLSYGTLYPALRRLERREQLTRQTIRDGRGPAKHVYALTPAGEQAFLAMMREVGSPTEISDPHKFTLRLTFFRYLEPAARLAMLQQRLKFLHENRQSLTEMEAIPSHGLDRYRRALIRYHVHANAEEIAFVERLIAAEETNPDTLDIPPAGQAVGAG